MTPLAEASADLAAWLPVARALLTEPDIQPAAGRTAPGSRPPWNAAVAYALTDVHAGVRELEADFRYAVTGTITMRGGSDGNTIAAIDAVCRLAEALDQAYASEAARLFNRWVTGFARLPAVDLEQPWRVIPGPCPRCGRPMLRYQEGDKYQPSRLACLGCLRKARIAEGTVSDGCVEWDDGMIT